MKGNSPAILIRNMAHAFNTKAMAVFILLAGLRQLILDDKISVKIVGYVNSDYAVFFADRYGDHTFVIVLDELNSFQGIFNSVIQEGIQMGG